MHDIDSKCLEGEWDSSCQDHQEICKGKFAQDDFTGCDVLLADGFEECTEDGQVPRNSYHVQWHKANYVQDEPDLHFRGKI